MQAKIFLLELTLELWGASRIAAKCPNKRLVRAAHMHSILLTPLALENPLLATSFLCDTTVLTIQHFCSYFVQILAELQIKPGGSFAQLLDPVPRQLMNLLNGLLGILRQAALFVLEFEEYGHCI
jgi:hypothetical protein